MRRLSFLLLLAVVLPLAGCGESVMSPAEAGQAAEAPPKADAIPVEQGDPRVALAAKIPGTKPEDLRPTPIKDVFELTHGTDISYVTSDAKYVFSGDLYRVTAQGDFPNLTEVRRRGLRLDEVATMSEKQMLLYGPANAKHTITVFTDIDCPWCRKMHAQVADYNKLGIRVRYLFYPRTGPNTESWFKANAVWCAKDRNKALTQAKLDQPIEMKNCPDSPVAQSYSLGRELGLTGTPGVVLDSGELVPGYLPPDRMLKHIEESAAENASVAAAK
jgi:thiol:disulfide interchange protein DsbC